MIRRTVLIYTNINKRMFTLNTEDIHINNNYILGQYMYLKIFNS